MRDLRPSVLVEGDCATCALSDFDGKALTCPTAGMCREARELVERWRAEVTFDDEGFPRGARKPCPCWLNGVS